MAPQEAAAAPAAPAAAAAADHDNDNDENDDPPLLRLLLHPDHHHHAAAPPAAVAASVLLLPASPDFLCFRGRVLLEEMQGASGSQQRQRLALPLFLRCGAPGGPVILSSLRGDARFRRLWAAVVSPGHQERLGSLACSRDVGSFAAELGAVLEEALLCHRRLQQPQQQATAAVPSASATNSSYQPPPDAYLRLLRELQTLGWAHVELLECSNTTTSITTTTSTTSSIVHVTLQHRDGWGRAHSLRLTLAPGRHPNVAPLAVGVRLPGGVGFEPQPTAPDEEEEEEEEEEKGEVEQQRGVSGAKRARRAGASGGKNAEEMARGGGKRKGKRAKATWGLCGVLRQFAARVAQFQPFWEAMDDLDARCLCLGDGQEGRDRASVTRRLVLPAPHASLVVRLDPADPRGVCDARFIGPESVTRPLQEKLYRHLGQWDPRKLPRENLEALLGLTFPPPLPPRTTDATTAKPGQGEGGGGAVAAMRGECGVCYAYRLKPLGAASIGATEDGGGSAGWTTPTVACDNPRCGRIYHPKCLRGWLATLPGATQGGGGGGGGGGAFMGLGMGAFMGVGMGVTMVGRCPYCTEPITVEVPPSLPLPGGGGGE